jgi:phage terminase large subunit-like protein
MTTLDHNALSRWRANPITFVEEVMIDPETKRPFQLLPAERQFLQHAFQHDRHGRLLYPEQLYSCPKKSGKTTFAALCGLTVTLLFGGAFPEAVVLANDYEQAQARVFTMLRRIVECSPALAAEARITQDKIVFPTLAATITAIGSDYASAAGGNYNIAIFDELWAYTSERAHRLWDEMIPPPTRQIACRLTVTYAGFAAESQLLEGLYKRGLQQPLIAPDLYAGDGLLTFWSHTPIAPWQDERWLAEMRRSLRPHAYLRLVENRFVASESSFIDLATWDQCVDPAATPLVTDRSLPVCVGVDASVKRDSTAIAVVHWHKPTQKAKLIWHRIYQPSPSDPIDFQEAVEATVLELHRRFRVKAVYFDPYQMQASAQRLVKAGVKMVEFPQTVPNLTAASQHLYELISGRNLVAYPDAAIRLAISRAIAVETARGWRIAKDKQSHKIDVVVALAMAAYAALQTPKGYDTSLAWIDGTPLPPDKPVMQFDNGCQRRADANYIASGAYSRNQTYAAMSAFGKTEH